MKRSMTRRLAALALVAALAAPAAWAGPLRLDPGSWWVAAWGWLADLWVKDGPALDPDGRPSASAGGGAAELPSDGWGADPEGRGLGDCTDDGPALDPNGKP